MKLSLIHLSTQMIVFRNWAQRHNGTTAQQPAHVEQKARRLTADRQHEHSEP